MKQLVIYSGGFHPFGPHHYQSYLHLCEKFGKHNVYVATTDYVTDTRPFTFEEKQRFAKMYKVELSRVKSPYKCTEITQYFNPESTQLIFANGSKDKDKNLVGKYFKSYSEQDIFGFDKNGYIYEIPHISINKFGREISGTVLRETLSGYNQEQFTDVMGWYDPKLHELLRTKFPLKEGSVITKTQLQRIEQYADRFFKEFGIDINFGSNHFFQRLNDPRNITQISSDELRNVFRKASIKHGYKLAGLNPNAEGVLKDMESDINVPFIMKWDKENQEIDLIPKTIMRKSNFKSSTPVFQFEGMFVNSGKRRHIAHLYEDSGLDVLQVVKNLLDCKYDLYEKADGQSFAVTFRNNQVLASRNKGQFIEPTSHVDERFQSAYNDLKSALMGIDQKVRDLLEQHNLFLTVEILNPQSRNVFYYGERPKIVLHGLVKYGLDGNEVGRFDDTGQQMFNEFSKYNMIQQYTYDIVPPNKLEPNKDLLSRMRDYFIQRFDKNNLEEYIAQFGYHYLNTIYNNILSKSDPYDIEKKVNEKVENCSDLDKLRMYDNYNKIKHIKDYPTFEGVVFQHEGKLYKLTGMFRYINQIINMGRY